FLCLRSAARSAEAGARFFVKGVSYGTFAPDSDGYQFPSPPQIAEDFRLMASLGLNTVRTYTVPRRELLDEAGRRGLRVMVGLPWPQHVAFLDNRNLHREPELRAYLARLQHIAGHKPLLLAEAGADSIREGEAGQAEITSMHIRAAFEEGACGVMAYSWTDEWWRGGSAIDDWKFGLVDRDRTLKPAAVAVAAAFANAPFSAEKKKTWPRVSVVVCAYNAADTLDDNLASLERLTYPDFEIILVNDGSKDRTGEIARRYPRVRVIDTPNQGLGAARNVGLAEATGEIVAYTDADTRVDL